METHYFSVFVISVNWSSDHKEDKRIVECPLHHTRQIPLKWGWGTDRRTEGARIPLSWQQQLICQIPRTNSATCYTARAQTHRQTCIRAVNVLSHKNTFLVVYIMTHHQLQRLFSIGLKTVLYSELEMIGKGAVLSSFKALYRQSPGKAEENIKKYKIGNVHSLEYADIPKESFTSHNIGHCCTNVIRDHCWTAMCANNGLKLLVTVAFQCVLTMTSVPIVEQQCILVIVAIMSYGINAQRVTTMTSVLTIALQWPWSCGTITS